jgi:murein DD-endopeptidase MepM/ murein hydrolase activator NlpD
MSEVLPGIYAPMDGLSSYDPLQGGYAFCDITDNGATFHPGCDLNAGNGGDADLGIPLRFPIGGTVINITWWDRYSTGYGNHIWVQLDNGDYLHYCHCNYIEAQVGKHYNAGDVIGECGKSGNQPWAHLHFEIRREDPSKFGYDYWPYGQPRSFVEQHYIKPNTWWQELLTYDGGKAVSLLEDWQIKGWILADLYQQQSVPFNPDAAISNEWVNQLKNGNYLGRPIQGEHSIENGSWQEFERGVVVYQENQGTSING